jgi:GNAT superfamily N-acetyltransferase
MGSAIDRTLGEQVAHRLKTRSGLELDLRQVTADDGPVLADLFARVTIEDLRFRFLTGLGIVKPHHIVSMIEIDHRQAEHLLAFDHATGTIVGSMMIVADLAMERAEVAIVVAKDFRGKGAGWTLLRHAADIARERGFRSLCAIESREHHDALEVERALGFKAEPYEGDTTLVVLESKFG